MSVRPATTRRLGWAVVALVALTGVAVGGWWYATRGDELATLRGHDGVVRAVAFAPDGKTLASGGDDGTVRLWDVAARSQVRELTGHTGKVRAVAFAGSGVLAS